VIEPKLKLFEIPWVKFVNNLVIIATCAFTGYLFLTYLPGYFPIFEGYLKYVIVAAVVLCAVLSSTDIRYVKLLSLGSTWLFFALIAVMWFASGMGVIGFGQTITGIGEYFTNIHKFVRPLTDYHAFYLFWWFAWSIMIGQFVARFVGGLSTRQLLFALLVFPSIPIAIWFTVLYHYHSAALEISPVFKIAMVCVGVVFVINSLDSLTRLYSDNLGLTVKRLGGPVYVLFHWILLFSLILAYQKTPFKIEWVGLVVIGIYTTIYILLVGRRHQLKAIAYD
jgi:choline-glycine betaine transporter